jgi:hypothetical protein
LFKEPSSMPYCCCCCLLPFLGTQIHMSAN